MLTGVLALFRFLFFSAVRLMDHAPVAYSGAVVLAYLLAVAGIGSLIVRTGRERTVAGYFLANRNLGWLVIGASLFVTTACSVVILGVWTSAFVDGWAVASAGIISLACILLLGFVVAPKYLREGVYTAPRFMADRGDRATGLSLSALSIALTLLIRIPVSVITGCWLLNAFAGWGMIPAGIFMVALSGLLCIAGGHIAVVHTQALQAVVVLAGTVILSLWGLAEPGLVRRLADLYSSGVIASAGVGSFPSPPVTAVLPALLVLGVWYWWSDQYVLQRMLGARNEIQTRSGSLLAAALLLLLAGVIALPLFSSSHGSLPADPATPELAVQLFAVVILALVMAALAGYYHSVSSLFTMDFYPLFHAPADDTRQVLVGRLSATVAVVPAILVASSAPLVGPKLVGGMLALLADIVPPVAAVSCIGLFWKRGIRGGGWWGLIAGEALGLGHFSLRIATGEASLATGQLGWSAMWGIPFIVLTFVISAAVAAAVALFRSAPGLSASMLPAGGGIASEKKVQ